MDLQVKTMKQTAVVASRIASLLVDRIEKNVKLNMGKAKECPEMRLLKEKCCDANAYEAFCGFQGITLLVQKDVLNASQTVTSLISLLPSIIHYSPLVVTVGNIMMLEMKKKIEMQGKYECQYNFTDKPHPFVVILKHDAQKSWDAILEFFEFLTHKHDEVYIENILNLFRTFFMYIFCDPSSNLKSHKKELFFLLLKQQERPVVKTLLVQALAWQKIDFNYCWQMQKIFQVLLDSTDQENHEVTEALMPYLARVIKWLILNGHNPIFWIDLLSEALKISSRTASAVLFILTDVILYTPAIFINNLVELCTTVIYSRTCNRFVAQKFVAVSLSWMVNPSSLAEPVFHSLENVIRFLNFTLNDSEWTKVENSLGYNKYFDILKNSDNEVKMAVEVANLSDKWVDEMSVMKWLKYLTGMNNILMEKNLHTFLSGIFLYGNDDDVREMCFDILLKISYNDSEISFFQFCLLFFKLSTELEPKRQLKYLQGLSNMASSKENVPLIIAIVETLKTDSTQSMLPLVIDLYLRLWKADKRTYPYLHKVLLSSGHVDNYWEVNVMKTIALREICKLSPDTCGKSLVPKLSEILNDCDNYESGLPSAIAIEAVIELCKASVTDITGTWRALKPKLSRDKRTEVILTLCKLFSEIPSLKPPGAERDGLINDVIPRLWEYAMSKNLQVVKAALLSLSKFNSESYGCILLPDILKSDVYVPKQFVNDPSVSKSNLLAELPYIPGECWIELIRRIDPRAVRDAGDMIVSLIQDELSLLSRRFFCQPEEMPEPTNYSLLPHSSICRALVTYIKKNINPAESPVKNVPDPVVECLRILSADYRKCLPVLDWSFLEFFLNSTNDCKKYSILILTRQAPASRGGRRVLENYMVNNIVKFKDVTDFMYLYSALPVICNSLSGQTLRQFLHKTIKLALDTSINFDTNDFENILSNAAITVESKVVAEPRKALLIALMQSVLTEIPPEHRVMKKFAEFAAGFPYEAVERVTSLASSTELTSDVIHRSIFIRSAVAFRPECPNPLVWFNECIDAVVNVPKEHHFIITSVLKILRKRRDLCHGNWMTELMWRVQTSTSSVGAPETIKGTLFLFDIFMMATITISGYDSFLELTYNEDMKKKALELFPAALYTFLDLPDYSSISPKVIDWVYNLSKWKNMPEPYVEMLEQAILTLRTNKFCSEKNKWLHLFYLPAVKN